MKAFWRTGEIEKAKAASDIDWLEDKGFWTLAGKLFDQMETNLSMRLNQPSNTRDVDMYLKGQIHGAKDIKRKLNELMRELKSGVG